MAESLASIRGVELVTERGRMVIALETRTAPLTCMTFVQLARSGFFDGLDFHRVIADFVAQGGDPRGDGWGGPGFLLRDENSRQPFERGIVGMAKSGPHTAGSQFFLTMSEQPHLNGSYTVLGRVVSGDEWLESIEQGDLIVSIREIEFGESD
jgi:cyclophilin family peptidyl-prolyl cis-trans isomerase